MLNNNENWLVEDDELISAYDHNTKIIQRRICK